MKNLPIYPYLGEIADTLISSESRSLVLTAETAAGKSTAVPIGLLGRVTGSIVMLEPRRLATVAIANRVASLLGDEVGDTAGYRLRLDSKVSGKTRIEVMTEAILTRRIQDDPSLSGVSIVIIDEFHERSIHADLALALLKEIMSLRDDLYVLVMSATIDASRVASYLGAPTFHVAGRSWPIEIAYPDYAGRSDFPVEEQVARAVKDCLSVAGGNILAFLPGIAEIRKVAGMLTGIDAELLVLHSSIPLIEQKRILSEPDGEKNRRVVLSSSIAETSLTVPGVSVVIDSGLSRIGRFNVATGMNRLVTETESVFSATQRAGRAGRTGPGRCVRLWAERDLRVSETPPEILRSDLTSLVLECALWGVSAACDLSWLDSPPEPAWNSARELLIGMEALDDAGRITDRGRLMASLGVHPRVAAVALSGDVTKAALYAGFSENPSERARLERDLERRVERAYGRGGAGSQAGVSGVRALLSGFPDRIARHAENGVYQFPSGRLASLPREIKQGTARQPEWIVAPEVDAGEREGRIYAFEPVSEAEALDFLSLRARPIVSVTVMDGKGAAAKVVKVEKMAYGKIVLFERRLEASREDIALAACALVRKAGIASLPWTSESEAYLARARFARARQESGVLNNDRADGRDNRQIPPCDETSLLASLEDWLIPFIPSSGKIDSETLGEALASYLPRKDVDRLAPARIVLPNGLSRPILYEELVEGDGAIPILEIKVQELFGCPDTPIVSGVPALLRLLSPARRPIQITRDLSGFWKGSWLEVRKELRGRYPKHSWPEDPCNPNARL